VASTRHVPNRTDTGRSVGHREVALSERSRCERVRELGDCGVKATAAQFRGARKRISHDTMERVSLMLDAA
jgi:hypothetical protein